VVIFKLIVGFRSPVWDSAERYHLFYLCQNIHHRGTEVKEAKKKGTIFQYSIIPIFLFFLCDFCVLCGEITKRKDLHG
jgi:hypothetical protein